MQVVIISLVSSGENVKADPPVPGVESGKLDLNIKAKSRIRLGVNTSFWY